MRLLSPTNLTGVLLSLTLSPERLRHMLSPHAFPILGCGHNKGVGFSQPRFSFSFSADHLAPLAQALKYLAEAWCFHFFGFPISQVCMVTVFVLIAERLLFSSLTYLHL
jgi:hypothetical protein